MPTEKTTNWNIDRPKAERNTDMSNIETTTKKNGLIIAQRFHDISCGHRVYGHESKCAHLHGHNYRMHFNVIMGKQGNKVDDLGRVMDFSVIKTKLCMWLEDNWDHKMLIWEDDIWASQLLDMDPKGVVLTPFNPTAENMAEYLVQVIGPQQLKDTGCHLVGVKVEETYKCHAMFIGDPSEGSLPFTD